MLSCTYVHFQSVTVRCDLRALQAERKTATDSRAAQPGEPKGCEGHKSTREDSDPYGRTREGKSFNATSVGGRV